MAADHEGSESYRGFARVYDEMMASRDYKAWAAYVIDLAQDCGIRPPGKLLDLACGTGSFLKEMAQRGWSVAGVDNSPAMLGVAQEKLRGDYIPVHLYEGDMRNFQLGEEFLLITCMCDSFNYLLEPMDLLLALRQIKAHLASGGLLIADLNTEYKYEEILGNGSFAETFPNSAYIWENTYDSETRINRMDIDFFIRERGEFFRHISETHFQRYYPPEEVVELAHEAGFAEVNLWAAFTKNSLNSMTERELFEMEERRVLEERNAYEIGRMFLVAR